MNDRIPSPREFMRARRPDRFSDSLPAEHSELERSILEYHLDTLTSRNQELDFESFAREIAQREICPNLLPHTGPTGGGDSKVDTETYPVSDQLALAWYSGLGRAAAEERWAFAISAKANWRAKLRSDTASITATARGYSKVFFITNQFVRDKERAEIEDELRSTYGVDVRILDRSWLVAAVLDNHHEDIAIATLAVPSTLRHKIEKGPRDTQRELRLAEIDHAISEALGEGSLDIPTVEQAIDSALIARSLDLPRAEVDGRFKRAVQLAEGNGTRHQRIDAVYQWAWATYFWHEDISRFNDLYGEVEGLVLGTDIVNHVELLTNLWMCLYTAVSRGSLDSAAARLEQRTQSLLSQLDRLAANELSPGSSLYARTLTIQVRLLNDPSISSQSFSDLRTIVQDADSLANYPFTILAELVLALGEPFGSVEGFDELFELVVEISSRREGEVAAAQLLLQRAAQLVGQDRHYAAIAILGTTLTKLYKDESRDDLVRALYMIGYAYSKVDLLWASRGSLVTAASVASHSTWTRGEVSSLQKECSRRLKWLELELGRIPQALDWLQTEAALRHVSPNEDPEADQDDHTLFDGVLGLMFLRADLPTLRFLEPLPPALQRLDLHGSALALTYALGHEDLVPSSWASEPGGSVAQFRIWRDQPAADQVPHSLSLGVEPQLHMRSSILGCDVEVRCDNISPCIEIAESLLASIEAFFSTGLAASLACHEPRLSVVVRLTEYADPPFSFRLDMDQTPPSLVVASRRFDPHSVSHEDQDIIQERIGDVIVALLAHLFMADDLENALHRLMGDERAMERAVAFTRSFVTVGNVLGHSPRTQITEWLEVDDQPFPLTRQQRWDEGDQAPMPQSETAATVPSGLPRYAQGGEAPPEILQRHMSARHTEIRTVSLIRLALWDEAQWQGVVFASWGDDVPPLLGLLFRNIRPATSIFRAWRDEFGEADTDEALYLSIVRGISARNPSAYRVLVGADPGAAFRGSDNPLVFMVYRIHTMEPTTPQNLERFLEAFQSSGRYQLAPAVIPPLGAEPRIGTHLSIEKRQLMVRQAWEVGPHEPEAAAIQVDDDPIIPPRVPNAPVRETLARKAARRDP